MLTVEQVFGMMKENGFGDTKVICPDGTEAWVTPCGYTNENTAKPEDIEYFLLSWDMPWGGNSRLEKVVTELNNHAALKAEFDKEREELRAYFNKHNKEGWDDDSWDWYSDWHKDLYGYRPHGKVCGEYVKP